MAPLEIRTFPGAGGGMDQAGPIHMLPDSKARWIVDGLVDRAGLVHQRGKVKGVQIDLRSPYGMMASYNPAGTFVVATHVSDDTTDNAFRFTDIDNASLGTHSYGGNYGVTGPPTLWDSSPLIRGPGQAFTFMTSYLPTTSPIRGMGFWRGGYKADYSAGTFTSTVNSTAVTGASTTWTTNVVPGMFLLWDRGAGNWTFIGVVKTVNSNTSITLEDPALFTASAQAYKLTSVRGMSLRIGVGRISGAAGQAVVNGTGTKFRQIGASSTWALFRQRDMFFLGNVSTIQSDTQLTLAANIPATGDVANDRYIAIKIQDTFVVLNPTTRMGTFPAAWQGRQWYGNAGDFGGVVDGDVVSKVWYSELDDYEAVDASKDGANLDITSVEGPTTPILKLFPTKYGLVVFKETETFIITGSADPNSWEVKKLADEGLLCATSVVGYQGGVVWASDRGIMHYDGTEVNNLTRDSLGDFWTKSLQTFEPFDNRIRSFIERDHVFCFIDGAFSIQTGSGYFKGSTEFKPSFVTFCLNIQTGAITLLTNVGIRGWVFVTAAGTQESTVRFVVERGSDASTYLSRAITLFFDEGTSGTSGGGDDFACAGQTAGPDFYIESARYDMDDPQIRKLWKQVQIFYLSASQPLHLDTVLNFDTNGITSASAFATSSSMVNKRFKFLKRGQLLGFRVYSIAAGGGTASNEVQLGPWAIGFKRQRPGRV